MFDRDYSGTILVGNSAKKKTIFLIIHLSRKVMRLYNITLSTMTNRRGEPMKNVATTGKTVPSGELPLIYMINH